MNNRGRREARRAASTIQTPLRNYVDVCSDGHARIKIVSEGEGHIEFSHTWGKRKISKAWRQPSGDTRQQAENAKRTVEKGKGSGGHGRVGPTARRRVHVKGEEKKEILRLSVRKKRPEKIPLKKGRGKGSVLKKTQRVLAKKDLIS